MTGIAIGVVLTSILKHVACIGSLASKSLFRWDRFNHIIIYYDILYIDVISYLQGGVLLVGVGGIGAICRQATNSSSLTERTQTYTILHVPFYTQPVSARHLACQCNCHYCLRLLARCIVLRQYYIGYLAGKSVHVQRFVGVDKVPTRAMEMILNKRGQDLGSLNICLVGMMLMAWRMLRNRRHWILFSVFLDHAIMQCTAHKLTAIHHPWGFALGKVCILVAGPDFPTSVLCGILKLNVPQMLLGTTPVIIVSIIPQASWASPWKVPKDLETCIESCSSISSHAKPRPDHVILTLPKMFKGSDLDCQVSLSTNWYTRLSVA